MENGKNVYKEREVNQKEGKNYSIYVDDTDNILNHLHQKSLKLKVAEIIEQPGARTFRLVPVSGYLPVFEAGQYLNIFTEIEGVRTSRPYSICSSPKQRSYYEITVARIPNGFVSDYLIDHAKVDDVFETSSTAGTFRYNPVFHSPKSVFIALVLVSLPSCPCCVKLYTMIPNVRFISSTVPEMNTRCYSRTNS